MRLQLNKYVDKGCWISDDRVNAFISVDGIAELGYHGTQPVSRNSRMFAGTGRPVLTFAVRTKSGGEQPVSFDEVDWNPSSISVKHNQCDIEISAGRSSLFCSVTSRVEGELILRFAMNALYRNVQGNREWTAPVVTGDSLTISCRDTIILDEWLQRSGPYAGDFLIPEPMRRMIFGRDIRSGQATIEDLKPAFRDVPLPVYDARVFVKMEGNGFVPSHGPDGFRFVAAVRAGERVMFTVGFGNTASGIGAAHDSERGRNSAMSSRQKVGKQELPPSLSLSGFPRIEDFFTTVPGLVRSAIVRDIGMPRATPAAYYWVWAWDAIVTGLEMIRWGDSGSVRRMIGFVNSHRDEGGLIPGRWTRSLLPLDTPPRGAIEFLFALLVYEYSIETGERVPLIDSYPFFVHHLREIDKQSNKTGMVPGEGFYPDFPSRFGRSGRMAVAMEVAAHYSFCRLLENIARLMHDAKTEAAAAESADLIEHHFMEVFWDEEKGFLRDAVDIESGESNMSYPIFSLLFLQAPPGLPLIRREMGAIAAFLSGQLLGPVGTSMVPPWDKNRKSEDATGSWYPHWDVYLVKLLRRTGRIAEIMQWLNNVERALEQLGYCPEFVKLDPFVSGDPGAWSHHGAASNLNCVTGWYRALVEGVAGIEIDPGGITVVPACLPFETIRLNGLVYRNCTWNIIVHPRGKHVREVSVDGERVEGCSKIPSRFYDGQPRTMEIWYDDVAPLWTICEAINAEVLHVSRTDQSLQIRLRPLGTVDVVFTSKQSVDVFVDGKLYEPVHYTRCGEGAVRVRAAHDFDMMLRRTSA